MLYLAGVSSDDPVNPYAPPKTAALAGEAPDTSAVEVTHPPPTWKTIFSGTSERALDALRTLERAKIESRLLEDGAVGSDMALHWVRSNPLGGFRVQVHPADVPHAAKLLGVEVEADERVVVNLADERMQKAVLFATFGLLFCPVLAQCVSLALIAATPPKVLTAVGRKGRRLALLVDLAVLAIGLFLVITDPLTDPTPKLPVRPDPAGLRR